MADKNTDKKADKKSDKKSDKEKAVDEPKVTPRLAIRYKEEIAPALKEEFNYSNPMMIPRLKKVVINMGIGRAVENKIGRASCRERV